MNDLKVLFPFLRRHRASIAAGIIMVLLTNALALWVPILVGEVVNYVEKGTISMENLLHLSIFITSVAGLAGCFRFLMRRLIIDCSREIEYEFRNAFFKKLQTLDPSFFTNNNTGDLMSRATNDMDALRMMIGPAVMYSSNTFFNLPLVVGGMLLLNWKLTVASLIPMLFLPPLVKYFGHQMHVRSRQQQDSFGDMTTMVQENLAGIRVVKAYCQEDPEEEKFFHRNNDYIDKSLSLVRIQSFFFPTIRLIVGFGFVILLMYGGWLVMNEALEIGTLLSFFMLFGMVVWPMIAAGWVLNIFQRGLASLQRINLVMHAEPRVKDNEDVETNLPQRPEIHFDHLTFQYEGTSAPQLYDIDLRIEPGKTIGVIGPVGSGKSTLVNLLGRYFPVERGMLKIGGLDVNDWPLDELRRRVAFVFQEPFLFSDTIAWNVYFGSLSESVTLPNVEEVTGRAHIHEDITGFPKGYETVLGERGINLSGGQKQRTTIARAIIRDADILVLDDALSAVDTHTEEQILSSLRGVMEGKTTFLISHRISTLQLADEIIVIEDGRISQRGTHDELVSRPGLYAELYRKQLLEEETELFDTGEEEPEEEEVAR